MSTNYKIITIVFTALILVAASLQLQAQGAEASIQGTVTDTSGAAVPNATVQARNIGTGIAQSRMSDAVGRFNVPDLAVGDYEVQVSKMGFSTVVRKGITLTVGAQSVVDFALPVGQQQQTITVEGQASQVETTNATVGALVDQSQMRELPLNGRNFEQLILLAPGVQSFTAITPDSFAGRAPSYSIAGSRPEGQALLLDDENMQNFWNKGVGSISGTSLGVEAIGEFQTLTNTFSAQFGGNGAVVNAVSKSGTNTFHGSAFDFVRNSVFDARNFFDPKDIPAFRKNQFGGSLGGPIKKDKAFFFVNYEGIRQLFGETQVANVPACNLVPGVCTITATNPATAQAIAQTLAIYPAATTYIGNGIGTATEVGSQIAHENYVLGRYDQNLSDKDALFVRYVSDKDFFIEPFSGGGTSGQIPFWPEDDSSHSQFSTVEERRIISPTLVNVLHASYSRPGTSAQTVGSFSALQFYPGAGRQDGQVIVTGLSGIGGNTFTPFNTTLNRYAEGDDVSWTRGAHSIRFGFSATRFQANTFFPQRSMGIWTFQSLPLFLSGTAITLTGGPLRAGMYANRDFRDLELTPYFQDDWKVTSKLTVNLGLRWEFMTNPTDAHGVLHAVPDVATATGFSSVSTVFASNPSWKNWDPRIGFAYDPFSNHKTSIRGGFGIFHDQITPSVYAAYFWGAPPWGSAQQSNPTYPIPFSAITPTLPTETSGFNYNTNTTPYMIQYNLNIQREISSGTVFSIGYVGSHGVHLISEIEQNPPIATIDPNGVYHFGSVVAGKIVGNPRINPNLSIFTNLGPISSSRYNSLQVSLNRRLTHNTQVQVSYTYSKCIDNGATLGSLNSNSPGTVENPYDQSVDRGVCSFDIPQTLRANGLVALPLHGNRLIEGWQISGIETLSAGLPFNISTGFDDVGYQGSGTPRPNYVGGCNIQVGAVNEWFNPACFSVQTPGTLGNLGRDVGRGPHFIDTDIALLKDTKLNETFRLQFRAEVFNLFNHPELGLPASAIFTAGAAGACTATGAGCGNPNATAGRITTTVSSSRQIQFGLKLIF